MLAQWTAVLALFAAANASPVEINKRAFSTEQVERGHFLKNGPNEVVKTLRKYGATVPSHILEAAEARANGAVFTNANGTNGSAPAVPNDEYDSLYLTPVTVGNTTVQLDCDTGSADLWVFSSLQPKTQLTGHDYYQVPSANEMKGATWRITYGDGSAAGGKVYADKVVVGGVTATSQAVEAATSVSAQFQRDQSTDGLLGLSFSSLNTVRPTSQKTFFDNVKAELKEPLFAVALRYHAAGTYDFGFIDKSKYTGEITYINVNNTGGFWQFKADGYAVGSDAAKATTIDAIGDTGTTLVYLPSAIIRAYYSKVTGAEDSDILGGWVFPCTSKLPDFTFEIGKSKQTIPGLHINYAPAETGSSTCYGGLQVNSGLPFSILGDVFLKSKYVVHEAGSRPRLGFAQQAS